MQSKLPATVDVIVVGARCAGAATAMLLARAGRSVLLIDRGEYGTDILSTHALMRGGVLQLARWNLLDRIIAAGTPPVTVTTFHLGSEKLRVDIKPKFGVDALYAPRRTVLDRILVDAAVEAGATVCYGTRLMALSHASDGAADGAVLQDRTGQTFHVNAKYVVGADGIQSTVAEIVGAAVLRTGDHRTSVLYGYWPDLPVDGFNWHYGATSAVGVIPTNGGETLVFAGVPSERWSETIAAGRFEGFVRTLRETSPALAETISARAERPLSGFGGRTGYLRQSWGPGWALVGDAGYFKDPLTAHGITDAFRDAELLADAIVEDTPAALGEYQRCRDQWSEGLFEATDRIASFEWTLDTVGVLLERLNREMADDVKRMVERASRRTAVTATA
jgi:flavin-dependent dehydrogenase